MPHRLIFTLAMLAMAGSSFSCKSAATPDATAPAATETSTKPDTSARAAGERIPYFLAGEQGEGYVLTIPTIDGDLAMELAPEPSEECEECLEELATQVEIPAGHDAIPKALRDVTHYTVFFEDGARATYEVAHYEYIETPSAAFGQVVLKGPRKDGARAVVGVAGDGVNVPAQQIIRPTNLQKVPAEDIPEEALELARRVIADNLGEDAGAITTVHETRGKSATGEVRVVFFSVLYEDGWTLINAAFIGEDGAYYGSPGHEDVAAITATHWIDLEGDGREDLLVTMDNTGDLSTAAVRVTEGGQLEEELLDRR